MCSALKPVKITSVRNTDELVIVTFEDGQEFAFPGSVLHSVIPKDRAVSFRIQEMLLRSEAIKTELVH